MAGSGATGPKNNPAIGGGEIPGETNFLGTCVYLLNFYNKHILFVISGVSLPTDTSTELG